MTEAEKWKRARQLLRRIIDNPPTYNMGSGEECYYCDRYTKDGTIVDDTPETHAQNCLIVAITSLLLED